VLEEGGGLDEDEDEDEVVVVMGVEELDEAVGDGRVSKGELSIDNSFVKDAISSTGEKARVVRG
jgi:hypothetical protein